jgi:dihydropteroate synthase
MNSPAQPKSLRCGDRTIAFRRSPLVMGVLNVTPDSFSDGGKFVRREAAVEHALRMAAEGADIIDIGGESTRPGSDAISAREEMDRVLPVIETLSRRRALVPLAIDTCKPEVAKAALAAGCTIVNDVTAAQAGAMADVLRDHADVPVILMHMLGEPKTMQVEPAYDDAAGEVTTFLALRAAALETAGIARERIVLDPGIGFGKRVQDNLEILKSIDGLVALGYPVLVGASRKSFIGTLLRGAPSGARLAGSLAVAAHCRAHGVRLVRVHDVRETVDLFRVLDAVEHPEAQPPGAR